MTMTDTLNVLTRIELDRRSLLRGMVLGGGGLAAAALIGCDDDDDDDDDGGATATSSPTGTATATGTAEGDDDDGGEGPGVVDFPARTPQSDADVQSYAEEFHWSRVQSESLGFAGGAPRMGGVATLSAASFGLASLHPTVEPVGQWPFCFTHSNLLGMAFHQNPDTEPATEDWSVTESYEIRGETEIVFNLRQNVTWHDKAPANGAPLTAQDVSATYELYKNAPLHADRFKEIEGFEEVEPGVLRLQLTNPASHMLNLLRVPQFAILNAAHIEEGDDALSTKAIGTGPFTQEQFQPDTVRVYKRNPNYWLSDANGNQLPYADGVVHQIIADPAAALAAFRTQQVDAYKPTSIQEFDQLRNELDVFAQVHAARCACNTQQLAFSRRNPLFEDDRVRRAFAKAINLQDMIDTVFGGAASQTGFIAWPWQGLPWPKPAGEMGASYQYDPAEARKMLDAAEVGDTDVPILFIGEISPGTGLATGNPYLESIRRDLDEVGIGLQLDAQDNRGFNRVYFGGEWDGMAIAGVGNATALDADAFLRFIETGSGLNASGFSDADVDDMIGQFRAEYDAEAGYEIARQIEAHVTEDTVGFGVSLPQGFGLTLWQRYMQNLIDAPAWWITGGAGQEFQEMSLTENVPDRDIDSF